MFDFSSSIWVSFLASRSSCASCLVHSIASHRSSIVDGCQADADVPAMNLLTARGRHGPRRTVTIEPPVWSWGWQRSLSLLLPALASLPFPFVFIGKRPSAAFVGSDVAFLLGVIYNYNLLVLPLQLATCYILLLLGWGLGTWNLETKEHTTRRDGCSCRATGDALRRLRRQQHGYMKWTA